MTIKVCPYNVDNDIRFATYTVPEASGYFITKRQYDVAEGDQLLFNGRLYSIIRVEDNWIWNKIANLILFVK